MRILLVSNRYPVDADDSAAPFVPHFARALTGQDVAVDVLTPDYSQPVIDGCCREAIGSPASFSAPVRVYRFAGGSSVPIGSWNFLNPASFVRLGRFLSNGKTEGERLCAANRYDHIFALWALPSGHFAQALSRRFGIPYSVWCLGSDIYTWARRPIVRARIAGVLRGAARVFGDGPDLCHRVRDWLGIEAHFLPSFRPLDGLDTVDAAVPTEAPRFLYLGRIHPAKGVIELLDAFSAVHRTMPKATLRYVGSGPADPLLRQRARALGLGESVTFAGSLNRQGIARALRECDCVVIPTGSDSIPLVFTEAVQAGRPVIGTDVGDLGTFIRRYRVGMVTPSVRTSELSTAMVTMAGEPVFDSDGARRLLADFDPQRAAATFCRLALGTEKVPSITSGQGEVHKTPGMGYTEKDCVTGEWPSGMAPGC